MPATRRTDPYARASIVISGEQAMLFIRSVRERLSVMARAATNMWIRYSPPLPLEWWVAESMTPCSRIVQSKRRRRQSIAGMGSTTGNSGLK
jgi:hypothetical protein